MCENIIMNSVGRPKKITEDKVKLLMALFNLDYSVKEACKYAGIGRRTFYDLYEKDNKFAEQIKGVKSNLSAIASQAIIREIKSGNISMSKWYLYNRDPRYAPGASYTAELNKHEQTVRKLYERINELEDQLTEKESK